MSTISRAGAALLLGFALFALLAVVGFATVASVERSSRARDSARAALLSSERLLAAVVDVETGQRGFVLTGDPAYLEPYRGGLARHDRALQALHRDIAGLPGMAAHLAGLDERVRQRIGIARHIVATRETAGAGVARRQMEELQGKQVTDAIRRQVAGLQRSLLEAIAGWEARTAEVTLRARWTAGALALLGTALILAGILVMEQERSRRRDAERALQEANLGLEARVAQRTAELELAREQLQTFARRLDRQVEGERRRLAREVHDQLGQVFTALKLTLANLATRHPEAAAPVGGAMDLLDEGVVTARRIASELRPPLLDDLGLAAAIEHRAQRFHEESGLRCEVDLRDADRLTPEQSLQLFRIVQELLTNVARHARATRVSIDGGIDEGAYRLVVADDGRGMGEPRPSSLGMLSILERTLLSGGVLAVDSAPGHGTRIDVRLPLRPQGETSCES